MSMSNAVLRTPPERAHVVVVGPVRNCGRTIVAEIGRLREVFASVFASVSFLLVESDSTDDSLDKLRQLELQIPGFAFLSMGTLRERYPIRCDRIAACRNLYIERIANDPRYAHIDYVLGADLDGVNEKLDADAIRSCWRTDVDWSVMTANQRLGYYDIWALRHPAWSPVDCWQAYQRIVDVTGPNQALEMCVTSKQVRIPPDAPPIEVESAFAGFAVYRRDAFVLGRYVGVDEHGKEVNEHIAFYAALRQHGHRVYINPAMINADYTEHTYYKTRVGHLRKRLMLTLRETADRLRCRDKLEGAVDALKRLGSWTLQHADLDKPR
ncbi:hypothetical protein [Cupriavidus sp. AU9028]|uniref:hypothetical protein n=1 Tax=Cupriavidus sp. AU9028 TaxID=2871157 RepID=UPI001C968E0F|nr:hypothetical protein [Cupriavidus sp. AU9028]MBY4897050.1 hypothetical protein [Cupriavidus sp. AU9028]